MTIKEYFMEYIGYVPFDIDGEVETTESTVKIKIKNNFNESLESSLKKFFMRNLKRTVEIEPIGDNDLEFIVNNWQKIIIGHELDDYLSLLLPELKGDVLIFKSHSKLVINKMRSSKNILQDLIVRHCGIKAEFLLEMDNTLKPDFDDTFGHDYMSFDTYETTENQKIDKKKNSNNINKKGDVILGRDFKKIPIDLDNVPTVEGSILVVKGQVFFKDYNEKSNISTIFITDKKDSIVVKHFFDKGEILHKNIKVGDHIIAEGSLFYDNFMNDFAIKPFNLKKIKPELSVKDESEEKRVELHCHSNLSQMDGIMEVKDIIKRVKEWGQKAVAITDHGAIQNIPQFYDIATKEGIKPIFGLEGDVVDEYIDIINIFGNGEQSIKDTEYVVFDFETTGTQPDINEIIEIGAAKVKDGEIIDKFHSLIKPKENIPEITTEITGITQEMLNDKPPIEEVLPKFLDFIEGAVLVAHNAIFDFRFLRSWVSKLYNRVFEQTYIDTLSMAKSLLTIKRFSLDKVVKALGLSDFNHHRADEDAHVTALVFIKLLDMASNRGIKRLSDLDKLKKFIDYKRIFAKHMTILIKNKVGLKNSYKLVSNAHIKYFYVHPRILKSELEKMREGLLIGSGCENGELSDAFIRGATKDELKEIAKFFDYLEIMPIDTVETRDDLSKERIIEMYRTIYEIGKELDKPVVMVSNAHYLDKEDMKFRHALKVADKKKVYYSNRHMRTTDEMLKNAMEIFEDEAVAKQIVIDNPNLIAEKIEDIVPLKKKLNPPNIENADTEVREKTYKKAHEIYGEKLPEIIEKRIERELDSIIKHGYAVLYLMAERIVKKSNEDGYLVGSRGSVGSSLVAYLMGITEVNPMPPHYICPKCKKSIFFTEGEYGSGYDLPDKICDDCNEKMIKNGQDILFETFMGFEGDKVPDIDLNFSGEYQSRAHKYVEKMFGEDHVFKAGTISTVAEKTALEYARKYAETTDFVRQCEQQRIANAITGVKRTTGQHPGGLMIVPKEFEVFDFTPIQYPANDTKSDIQTTHFDYHVIHDDLVKLDALGHDDPTFIKMLEDLTGIDALKIPMDDKETMSIFSSTKALKIDLKSELDTTVGALGIPEFGTNFVRRMLEDTKPSTFAELVRISGLSHGTNVWTGNAKNIIDRGDATLNEVISCRDDIMNYLIHKGADPKKSFFIMEKVRKGKSLSEEDEKLMKDLNVPKWFLDSCKIITYLFPKAHAAAYVSMAFRIAWFKVHKPLAFYATYFSVKGDEFNLPVILKGKNSIKRRLMEIKGERDIKLKRERTVLEIAYEMILRGYKFYNVDLYKSHSKNFLIQNNGLLIPFITVPNLGEKAAESIIEDRKNGKFQSIEELVARTNVNKSNTEVLKELGILNGLPDKNQMSLFGG
ncbi:PolC-type DNA polymerase III [Geotoga petraea]|jgi:DNA polymerase-3 subunit alpha (Gram-positive type)|uniref:DNA polymerase III PolC-type n=1 Tax=Geotoga petraea TaxID=28234 RepID=A0A1G6JFY3_9BACT|nr:PolC-type DNA polymerase III [Geotoga petraea]MDK2946122.1 polymerase subunit alpha, Gram-positive type [Geotoga sp.]TGG88195.1 PolC-type DNA polymerase III [Geotoga petraea]SDC16826.1 DNA polymerase III catalytic subunit, PolC type [Geotoga petraea]